MSAVVPIELVEIRASDECGCPEEVYLVGYIDTTVHIEPDGRVHVFMDGGDWGEAQTFLPPMTLDEARPQALRWAAAQLGGIPGEVTPA